MADQTAANGSGVEDERELIDAARREAAELVEQPGRTLPPPDSVPGFRIISEMGRGGMGVVYKAVQLSTKRIVALKVMLAGPFASRSARRRFRREVELAARFQHTNIVRVLEGGEALTGQLCYAMDCVDGIQLDRWLAMTQPDVPTMLRVFMELCEAVEYAHRQGVVHRDLKPANVLMDAEGKPYILDFGLSKDTDHTGPRDTLTLCTSDAGQVMGTVPYLSPEQAAGTPAEIDARTDVYALGVMCFEAVFGALPFDSSGSLSEALQRIRDDPPLRPSSLSTRAGGELETIILKALEKEKQRRYQSARELGGDIGRYLRNEPVLARRPSSLYIARKKVAKHRVGIGVTAGVIALALVSLWAGNLWREHALQRQRARELVNAHRLVLNIQHDLEAGRAQHCLGPAHAVFDQYPELPEARLLWAHVQFTTGRQKGGTEDWVDTAIVTLRDGLAADPTQWAYRALQAEIYHRTGEDQADQLEAQANAEAPDTAEAWYLRSFATLDMNKAVMFARTAVQRQTDYTVAWERLAHLCVQTRDFDGALAAAEKLVDLEADPTKWMLFQARTLIRQGYYGEAIAQCNRVTALAPKSPQAYRLRALAHLCLKEFSESVDDYSTAMDIESPNDIWERYRRATPLWILGRTEEAAADYRALREWRRQPGYADARLMLLQADQARRLRGEGGLGGKHGVPEEAAAMFETARRSVAPGTWLEKVFACLAGELAPVDLVAVADPGNLQQVCEACYYAGEVCLLTGRIDEARTWFQKCVQTDLVLDPNSVRLVAMNEYHLARWRLDSLVADTSTASECGPE